MAIKFVGVSYTDFTPKGEKEAITGYRFNFIDDDMGYSLLRGIGGESFNCWVSPENIGAFGLDGPQDMPLLAPYVGKTVEVVISRKGGKIIGWNVRPHEVKNFPPDTSNKPQKLGATA